MDAEGRPEGDQESDHDSLHSQGIHHDPLNERNEETWSALGEHEEENITNDTILLQPTLPELPAALVSSVSRSSSSLEPEEVSARSVCHAPPEISCESLGESGVAFKEDIPDETSERHTQLYGLFSMKTDEEARRSAKREEVRPPSARLSAVPVKFGIFSKKKEGSADERGRTNSAAATSRSPQTSPSNVSKEREDLDEFFMNMHDITKTLPLAKQIKVRREMRRLVMDAVKQVEGREVMRKEEERRRRIDKLKEEGRARRS